MKLSSYTPKRKMFSTTRDALLYLLYLFLVVASTIIRVSSPEEPWLQNIVVWSVMSPVVSPMWWERRGKRGGGCREAKVCRVSPCDVPCAVCHMRSVRLTPNSTKHWSVPKYRTIEPAALVNSEWHRVRCWRHGHRQTVIDTEIMGYVTCDLGKTQMPFQKPKPQKSI